MLACYRRGADQAGGGDLQPLNDGAGCCRYALDDEHAAPCAAHAEFARYNDRNDNKKEGIP